MPVTVIPDDFVERTEDFILALTSSVTQPPNVELGPNTQVFILDEDGKAFHLQVLLPLTLLE